MKVRTKFTLWISLAALATATIFSLFVYVELVEEPYRLIDRELTEIAGTVFNNLAFSESGDEAHLRHEDRHVQRYWLKIIDSKGKAIFASPLTREFDIPFLEDTQAYFIKKEIPLNPPGFIKYLWPFLFIVNGHIPVIRVRIHTQVLCFCCACVFFRMF